MVAGVTWVSIHISTGQEESWDEFMGKAVVGGQVTEVKKDRVS